MILPLPPGPGDSMHIDLHFSSSMNLETQNLSRKRRGDEDSLTPSGGPKNTIINPSLSSPSSQSFHTHPSLLNGSPSYTDTDKGPFIVHVSREIQDPAFKIFIRPITFCKFLHTHKISDIVKSVGRNRISVKFTSAQAANSFLSNEILIFTYLEKIPLKDQCSLAKRYQNSSWPDLWVSSKFRCKGNGNIQLNMPTSPWLFSQQFPLVG